MVGRGDQAQPQSERAYGVGIFPPPKQESDKITVNIQSVGGKSFKIQVGRDETVYEVMRKIYWLEGAFQLISRPETISQHILLTSNGKQLDQDRTMDECGIDSESLIHVDWSSYMGRRPTLPKPIDVWTCVDGHTVTEPKPDASSAWDAVLKPGLDALSDWRLKEQEWRVKEQEWRVREQELMQTIRDYSHRLQSGGRKYSPCGKQHP
jgi:hypothetical protein